MHLCFNRHFTIDFDNNWTRVWHNLITLWMEHDPSAKTAWNIWISDKYIGQKLSFWNFQLLTNFFVLQEKGFVPYKATDCFMLQTLFAVV